MPGKSAQNAPFRGGRWVLLLTAPALLIGLAAVAGEGSLLDAVVRSGFAPFCHQIPVRSPVVGTGHLVVCARCGGFYGGLALAGGSAWLAGALGVRWRVHTAWFLLLLPLAVDGTANLVGLWNTPEALRAAIGLAAAAPLAMALPGIRHATL